MTVPLDPFKIKTCTRIMVFIRSVFVFSMSAYINRAIVASEIIQSHSHLFGWFIKKATFLSLSYQISLNLSYVRCEAGINMGGPKDPQLLVGFSVLFAIITLSTGVIGVSGVLLKLLNLFGNMSVYGENNWHV